MKRYILIMISLFFAIAIMAQDEEGEKKKFYEVNKPSRPAFESGILIDGHTNVIPTAKTLEMMIQHRFSPINQGISDLFGIYGPGANARMGLNYSITDYIMVGWGVTKYHMINDFQIKVNILKQTRNNKVPVGVTFYGNLGIDGQEARNYGNDYNFFDRMSYFSELMFTRKFTMWLSLQAGISFTHFNKVAEGYEHDKIGLHFMTRAKISPQSAIVINFDWPLIINGIAENQPIKDSPKPNLGIGYEVATSTHAFQIFFGTADRIIPQYIIMDNQNDWLKGEFVIGFNITRLWSF